MTGIVAALQAVVVILGHSRICGETSAEMQMRAVGVLRPGVYCRGGLAERCADSGQVAGVAGENADSQAHGQHHEMGVNDVRGLGAGQ